MSACQVRMHMFSQRKESVKRENETVRGLTRGWELDRFTQVKVKRETRARVEKYNVQEEEEAQTSRKVIEDDSEYQMKPLI